MKEKSITKNKLLEMGQDISIEHKIKDLDSFNEEMTISQVVSFFGKNGYSFTKTMIQNYVRIGILPPPVNKRNYTKKHLLLLVFIYRFKTVFSLDEIKEILMPILQGHDELYETYHSLHTEALAYWGKSLAKDMDKVSDVIEKEKMDLEVIEDLDALMIVLTLMTQMIATKELIDRIAKEYLVSI